MTDPAELIRLRFETDEGSGARARIGLIVLESDQTLEAEARMIGLDGVDFYHSRIPNDHQVTPTTLTAMQDRLPVAAGLLSPDFDFDAIGYGCTSAATLIGPKGVTSAIQSVHPQVPCTDPIRAAIAAFRALESQRIAVVTPYTADVTLAVADQLRLGGLEVAAVGSFLESSDLVVGRISEASVAAGVRTVATASKDCDAIFVSCTNLRMLRIVEDLEQDVGKPVVSSNLALLWHLVRLAGIDEELDALGSIFGRRLSDRAATGSGI